MLKRLFVVLPLMLIGCGGDDSDAGPSSSCNAIGGSTGCTAASGGCNNTEASADGNLGTFATVASDLPGTSISTVRNIGGAQFASGSNAGVFITPPSGFAATDITLSTLLDQENTVVENATGPALTITPTQGDPATQYVSFTATAPFNGLRMTINTAGSDDYLVYEFCGAATVR